MILGVGDHGTKELLLFNVIYSSDLVAFFFLYYNKHHVGAVDGKIIFEFSIKVDR